MPASWEGATPYKRAVQIRVAERDFELGLDRSRWPADIDEPLGWEKGTACLHRTIAETPEEQASGKPGKRLAEPIKESILRFPSAPIHGLHRLHEYHVNEGESENFHTFRVLAHPSPSMRVRKIFLMHNGLNETQDMALYYRLASYLISQDPEGGTACILRPFPGHLTRSRFHRFAETPLDHYLWDGSHLFRQFLRYMIETQWLLSVIARRSRYRCISGLNLLAEDDEPSRSRLQDDLLSRDVESAWEALYEASARALEELHEESENATPLKSPPDDEIPFDDAVTSLRNVLSLTDGLGGDFDPGERKEPGIHVIGYSLGGFTAQSVFMSWPFLVSSCSTLLSGGALRELAPTAFADPEEWQSVLHSLRYELDDTMMKGRYHLEHDPMPGGDRQPDLIGVSGIEPDLFLFLKSTFYEVFQQEYRGSFQTRLAAFRRRMLFVVGGNDPIVRPQSVLDSGPPGGINMLAIGGLGHFLGGRSRDDEEEEQRSFWLPEIGRLIDRLANDAGAKQHEELSESWLDSGMDLPLLEEEKAEPANGGEDRQEEGTGLLDVSERMAVDGEGALPGTLFQRCLDDLLTRASRKSGALFVLRNEAPTALLEKKAMQEHAAALHHNESAIAKYIHGVRRRRKLLEKPGLISLILPWNAKALMEGMDTYVGHPSQSEGGGQMPSRTDPRDTWLEFHETCKEMAEKATGAIRICDGNLGVDHGRSDLKTEALISTARARLGTEDEDRAVKPSLPDCWIWMSPVFLGLEANDIIDTERARELLCEKVVPGLYVDKEKGFEDLSSALRKEELRIITVSRARYNPRFRGRIVADPKMAMDMLLHATLCIAGSVLLSDYDLNAEEPRWAAMADEA